jgi:hypothetical protein
MSRNNIRFRKRTIRRVNGTSNPIDESIFIHTNHHQEQQQQHRNGYARKKSDGLICNICEGPAHGYNFDAITCESCKAFFRRNALRSDVCINNN